MPVLPIGEWQTYAVTKKKIIKISNTIARLRKKDNWEDFKKNYEFGDLINHPTVERIIEDEKKNKQHQQQQTKILNGGKRLSELPRRTNGKGDQTYAINKRSSPPKYICDYYNIK